MTTATIRNIIALVRQSRLRVAVAVNAQITMLYWQNRQSPNAGWYDGYHRRDAINRVSTGNGDITGNARNNCRK